MLEIKNLNGLPHFKCKLCEQFKPLNSLINFHRNDAVYCCCENCANKMKQTEVPI